MLFSEVLVEQRLKNMLINTVKAGRVSHAQLFLGQEGTHAFGLAVAYAQYIACKNRTETDACGKCPSCLKFNHLAHPDLHFFFPHLASDKNSSADFIRVFQKLANDTHCLFSEKQLVEALQLGNKEAIINMQDAELFLSKLSLKPYESDYKFVIMYLPEKMNNPTSNKILKTLEEPDGKTLIILVSENYDNILPTILSRTQLFKINKLPLAQFAEAISRLKGCSIEIGEDLAVLTDRNLQEAMAADNDMSKETLFEQAKTMMQSAYKLSHWRPHQLNFQEIADFIKTMANIGRESQKIFFRYVLSVVRKSVFLTFNANQLVHATAKEREWMNNFSPFINERNAFQIEKVINDAIIDISKNAEPNILFTDTILKLGKLIRVGDKR